MSDSDNLPDGISTDDVKRVEKYIDEDYERFQGNQLRIFEALRQVDPGVAEAVRQAAGLEPQAFTDTVIGMAMSKAAVESDPVLRENFKLS